MARPISNIKKMEVPASVLHEENMEEILEAVSANKTAILNGINLLSSLEENGMLDMLDALVKHKETALETGFEQLGKPKYTNILENMKKVILMIGELNVTELEYFVDRINEGVSEARIGQKMEKTSYTDLLKVLKDPEINRSVTMILQFLRGMGKE